MPRKPVLLPWVLGAFLILAAIALALGAWWASVILLLIALAIAGGYLAFRRSLPRLEGSVHVPALQATVKIIRDTDAIPHIYAQHKLDAWFGLGYVHAQDRLWQMEIQRRLSQGRLSEIFGKLTLPIDRLMRTVGIARAARRAWELLPPDSRALIDAYIAGINAFIAGQERPRLSPEWSILRISPEAWAGADVLACIKLLAWDLGGTYEIKLLRNNIIQAVGRERAEQLMPNYPEDGPAIVMTPFQLGADSQSIAAGDVVRAALGSNGFGGEGIGSNTWVVDGSKSTTGKPILANDPHMGATLPSLWYLAHLCADDLDIIGATVPGLPGVITGRNRHIAWGISNLNPDVQDLFQERLDDTGCLAEFQGQMEPIELITEEIKIRRGASVNHLVRITRHGPLISDAINANNAARSKSQPAPPLEPLAFRWTALDPDDTTIEAFRLINEARNWEQFTQALEHYVAPALSFVYADQEGHIGYHASGRIPVRAAGDGSLPMEGWSGAYEWVRWVHTGDLPHCYDPPEHFVVAANQRPMPAGYPYFLGRDWHPPFRAQRIADLLQAQEQFDPADFADIQGDTVSLFAQELLPALLASITPGNAAERQAIELLSGWDGDTNGTSAAAALFQVWFVKLIRAIAGSELDSHLVPQYIRRFSFVSRFLLDTFKERTLPTNGTTPAPQPADVAGIAEQTFREALKHVQEKLGPDQAHWRWDRLHTARFPHMPFDLAGPLRYIFSRSVPNGGDWSTVNFGPFLFNGSFRQGLVAGYRQIVDLSILDQSCFIQTSGQSGHCLSSHYDDYLIDWHAIRYRPMRRTQSDVERAQKATLWLNP